MLWRSWTENIMIIGIEWKGSRFRRNLKSWNMMLFCTETNITSHWLRKDGSEGWYWRAVTGSNANCDVNEASDWTYEKVSLWVRTTWWCFDRSLSTRRQAKGPFPMTPTGLRWEHSNKRLDVDKGEDSVERPCLFLGFRPISSSYNDDSFVDNFPL